MEAARRIDEWSRIETKIPHLGIMPKLALPSTDSPLDLIPFEWEVLAAIDGGQDVRGISLALAKSEFEVAKTLFGLASAGIIQLEDPAQQPRDQPGGRELAIMISRAENELLAGELDVARQIAEEAAAVGAERMHGRLAEMDPDAASKIEPANCSGTVRPVTVSGNM